MKNSILTMSMFVFVIVSSVFSQNSNTNITDYFPVEGGNTWTYANASGKQTDVIIMKNSMPDNISNDGTSIYLFEDQFIGAGTTSTLYSIKQNRVVIMSTKNILGQYLERKPPYPILSPIGQEWKYNDRGEDLRYKTSNSSCTFDGKTFTDCILVEEQIFDGQNVLRTKKSYYAKGVGLVYVTLQSPRESESIYQKLINCNFIDINNVSFNNDVLQLKEDLVKTEMFFFIKLAEEGLELLANMENKKDELKNNNQKSIFTALCTLAGNDMSNILDMFHSGTLRMGSYLNSPVPDFLITINLGNRPISMAIDKALKIIVLSSVLNSLNDKLKNSISNQKYLEGTKEAEKLLSSLHKTDSSISNDDYNNVVEPLYREYINLYLRHGGK
jgi:hypothetical protein